MPRGGARPGSGRKKGGRNSDTLAKIEQAKKELKWLPHEILAHIAANSSEVTSIMGRSPSFEERVDAAKAAAPYFAGKLSSVEITADIDANVKTEAFSAEDVLKAATKAVSRAKDDAAAKAWESAFERGQD